MLHRSRFAPTLAALALLFGTLISSGDATASSRPPKPPKPPAAPAAPEPPEPPVAITGLAELAELDELSELAELDLPDVPDVPEPPDPPEPPLPPDPPSFRHFTWHGFSSRYIGVQVLQLTPELREHFGVDRRAGVLVAAVVKDSPAEKAGIKVGDILLRADGEELESSSDLRHAVHGKDRGETVELEISRGRSSSRVKVEVSERELRGESFRKLREERRARQMAGHLRSAERRLQERLRETEQRLRDIQERLR